MNRRHFVCLSTSTLAALLARRQGCLLCGSLSHTVDQHHTQTAAACERCSTAHTSAAPCPLEVDHV